MAKKDKGHVHNVNGRVTTEERRTSKHITEVTKVTHCTCGEEVGRASHDVWRD